VRIAKTVNSGGRVRASARQSLPVGDWSVGDLGGFYGMYRSELIAYASRILNGSSRAEEIVQDCVLKVILAAPELHSEEHARAYLRLAVRNACFDLLRFEKRRPQLIALDDVASELEMSWQTEVEQDDLVLADDAAIIREALALLSPAQRSALLMWEVEGLTEKEIAEQLGIRTSYVRHAVSRARANLRNILVNRIVDEENGLTALDVLSSGYRRALESAKKSSKAAFSIIFLVVGFFGFNTFVQDSKDSVVSLKPSAPLAQPSAPNTQPSTSNSTKAVESQSQIEPSQNSANKEQVSNAQVLKEKTLAFPGLDKFGVPTGFTIADSSGNLGSLYVLKSPSVATETEISSSIIVKTRQYAANLFLSQRLLLDQEGLKYSTSASYGASGFWAALETKVVKQREERLANGNYLLTVDLAVESDLGTFVRIASPDEGRDLTTAPRRITTKLVLDPSKIDVIAQAVFVVERASKL
jgi:RNA polymerase sigma factor (sigma-70 family)